MPKVIVNATALRSGGALTILKQFISSAEKYGYECEFYIFINECVKYSIAKNTNIHIIVKNVNSPFERILWDFFGLKRWLMRNKVNPSLRISLQNTGFRTGFNVPLIVYYHQPLPLTNHKWSIFNKNERSLWFYKYIYPVFVSTFLNQQTEVVVQLHSIKDGFANKFKFPSDRIHVIRPDVNLINISSVDEVKLDENFYNLFYPASVLPYKNHLVLFEAMKILNKKNIDNIVLHVTCKKEDISFFNNEMHVDFIGQISFEKVLSFYKSTDAVVFPSFIETFGLPLIEAASFGLPIIAADMPYSREVLYRYDGVNFVQFNDSEAWANEILKLIVEPKKRNVPISIPLIDSWSQLFKIINNKCIYPNK